MKNYEIQLITLINSKAKVIEIASYEWERVHGIIDYVAESIERTWYTWSSVFGIKRWDNGVMKVIAPDIQTISQAFDFYLNIEEDIILLMEDFHPYSDLSSPINVRYIRETMRNYNYHKANFKKTLILSSPTKFVPEELSKELPVIEIDLPTLEDLEIVAHSVIYDQGEKCIYHNVSKKLLESSLGLTIMEAKLAFARAILIRHRLTEEEIPIIIEEKENIIKKSGLLEYYHPNEDLESIGGLQVLKDWIKKRGKAYSEKAKKYGLNIPKGVMLLGVPGCGKSLTAKAIAREWKFPLLRFDLGKVYGGIVGESERNIRYALDVAKAISPCVLWIDEIEKGISGSQSSSRTDGGTSARVLGTFLTWMQEKTEPVFVVATTNDISKLPAELLRKGRFDEIFFVDLPNAEERKSIFEIHVKRKGRDISKLGLSIDEIVKASEGFSGAEIEEAINDSLYNAFNNNQSDINQENVIKCIGNVYPLSATMFETINNLRDWAVNRARFASNNIDYNQKKDKAEVIFLPQEHFNPFIRRYKDEEKTNKKQASDS